MKNFFRFLGSSIFFVNLVLAILLVVGGLYITLKYLDTYTLHSEVIQVPDLLGYQMDELPDVLDRMHLQFEISDSVYVKEKKGGEVLEQYPEQGKDVKLNRTIYVTIASYEPLKIKMPQLVDLSLRQAQTLLQSYGLEVGKLTYQPDLCKNCVLEQTIDGRPVETGQRILKGTKVDLTVGEGKSKELVSVPYCIELKFEEANQVLKLSSLNVGGISFDESVISREDSMNAKVYRQVPHFNTKASVPMGSPVDLFLTVDYDKIVHSINPKDSIQ